MHHHDIDWAALWQVWMWIAAIGWPVVTVFRRRKARLTDEERWQIFHEQCEQPTLMPDNKTLQKIEWKWVPIEQPAGAQPSAASRPVIRMAGRELTH